MNANPDRSDRSRPRRDVAIVVLATVITAALSSYFELSEAIVEWTRPWEHLQLDEIPAVLVVLSTTLAWFASRRHRDSQQELQRRHAAEERLASLLRDNRRLAQQLVQVQESERKSLARELHDELGQYLNAIKIEAITIEQGEAASPTAFRRSAAQIVQHTDHVYGVVRDLIRRLRPVALDTLGLRAALEQHVNDWRQRLPQLEISASLETELDDVDEPLALAVFRLVQEGLTNVFRHARAHRVDILVAKRRTAAGHCELVVSIADDGEGTEPGRIGAGLGLLGMRERIGMLSGEMDIQAKPGRGFSICARLPLHHDTAEVAG